LIKISNQEISNDDFDKIVEEKISRTKKALDQISFEKENKLIIKNNISSKKDDDFDKTQKMTATQKALEKISLEKKETKKINNFNKKEINSKNSEVEELSKKDIDNFSKIKDQIVEDDIWKF
jgi:hypothetical protein